MLLALHGPSQIQTCVVAFVAFLNLSFLFSSPGLAGIRSFYFLRDDDFEELKAFVRETDARYEC